MALATLVALLIAAPWLQPSFVWCGWISVALGLWMVCNYPGRSGAVWITFSAIAAIVIAFSWAPSVLADHLHSSYWIGVAVFVPLALLDAVHVAAPFWCARWLSQKTTAAWLPAALAAVVIEAIAPSVFPWRFGYSQLAWPWIIQGADLLGSGWTTFILFANAGAILFLVDILLRQFRNAPSATLKSPWVAQKVGILAVVLCTANALYGGFAIRHWQQLAAAAPKFRVGLIQVEPGYTESVPTLRRLTRQLSANLDLVCWPESSTGSYNAPLTSFREPEQIFAHSRAPERGLRPWPEPDCALLTGAQIYTGPTDQPSAIYQSAILIDKHEQIVDRYDKRYLMPFGEYLPGEGWIPGVGSPDPTEDVFTRGTEAHVLPLGTAKLGVMLCYEDMLPPAASSLCGEGANLLISLINGSDFKEPRARIQHRLLAQMRSIECRRYLLRCGATGETGVVTPWGTIAQQLPLEGAAALTAEVSLLTEPTWHQQIGWLFPAICALGLLLYRNSSQPRRRQTELS